MPLTDRNLKLTKWVAARQEQMVRDLEALVSIPTGWSDREGVEAVQRWMARRLQALGATIERVECKEVPAWLSRTGPNWKPPPVLIARRVRQGPKALLCGHVDTVHAVDGPFRGLTICDDGTATGPGCVDMKGGLVVMLAALEAVEAAGCAPSWTVVLVPDEESGSVGSSGVLAGCASGCDWALVYEPATAAGGLVERRPGSGAFLIDAKGRAAHAGRDPEKGISAVKALCEAVLRVLGASDPASGLTINIGPLQGGQASNIIPDSARAWGNVRYRDQQSQARAEELFESIQCGSAQLLPQVRVERAWLRPPLCPTGEERQLHSIARECLAELCLPTELGSTGGVSDANNIAGAGVPVLDGLGPRGGNMHRDDEFVILESLSERAALSALILARWVEKR